MTAKKLFSKTMPFVWSKLLLGGAFVLAAGILLAIFLGLGWIFGDTGIVIMFLIWAASLGGLRFLMMHYAGYLLKAGHVAVIAEAMAGGQVPDNQVNYGIAKVRERFATANIYFALDKLVNGAVQQIQKGIGRLGEVLDFIPGMDAVTGLAQFFVNICLGTVDECCLGWTFRNPADSAFKSAADGVVIYAQNWKPILKQAAKTMLKTILLCIAALLVIFVPVGLLFRLLKWHMLVAFLLACLIAWVVKFAFMDSYIMVQMMAAFMQVAPDTQITFDLYGKLCGISGKFKELFSKGQQEQPAPAAACAAAIPAENEYHGSQPTAAADHSFCGRCGGANEAEARFCAHCGANMEG